MSVQHRSQRVRGLACWLLVCAGALVLAVSANPPAVRSEEQTVEKTPTVSALCQRDGKFLLVRSDGSETELNCTTAPVYTGYGHYSIATKEPGTPSCVSADGSVVAKHPMIGQAFSASRVMVYRPGAEYNLMNRTANKVILKTTSRLVYDGGVFHTCDGRETDVYNYNGRKFTHIGEPIKHWRGCHFVGFAVPLARTGWKIVRTADESITVVDSVEESGGSLWACKDGAYYEVLCEGRLGAVGFPRLPEFHDGITVMESEGKFGYMDMSGKWILKPEYKWADRFRDGAGVVEEASGVRRFVSSIGNVGIIVHENLGDGILLMPDKGADPQNPRYRAIRHLGIKQRPAHRDRPVISSLPGREYLVYDILNGEERLLGLCTREGQGVVAPEFHNFGLPMNGIVAVQNKQGKWGFYQLGRGRLIECRYDAVLPFLGYDNAGTGTLGELTETGIGWRFKQ